MSDSESQAIARKRSVSRLGLDPYPWYEEMRRTDPVHYDERDDLWELFRYDDVLSVLADPALFSSQHGRLTEDGNGANLLVTDPPRHRKLRALISQAFTPRTIAQQEVAIHGIVNEIVDRACEQNDGRFDVIGDLAFPLPVIVIANMLGIPAEDRDAFKHWSDLFVSDSSEQAVQGATAIDGYFRPLVPLRRKAPQSDLISALCTAELDGVPLSDEEIINFCSLLLVAGNETTTNLIGNAFLCLDRFPEMKAKVWKQPELISGMLEEVLRYLSPVQRTRRIVKRDTELSGKHLKAGQQIFCWIGSANRDADQFAHPDNFDVSRSPNRHLCFGQGIHFCIGAPLARLESKVAFEILTRRFADLRCVNTRSLTPINSSFGYGVKTLEVVGEPRS